MTDVIDLQALRSARERPSPDCMRVDDYGRSMGLFSLEYQMDGSTWSINVWAYSFDDAEARVAAMRASLTLAGQIHEIIPA
jgi:hypothetical protein